MYRTDVVDEDIGPPLFSVVAAIEVDFVVHHDGRGGHSGGGFGAVPLELGPDEGAEFEHVEVVELAESVGLSSEDEDLVLVRDGGVLESSGGALARGAAESPGLVDWG